MHDRLFAVRTLQEDTSEADADVLAGVQKLKALKAELEDLEVQLENVTGIPRDKGAFRDAVVRRLYKLCPPYGSAGGSSRHAKLSSCAMLAGKGFRRAHVLHAIFFHIWGRQWTVRLRSSRHRRESQSDTVLAAALRVR